MKKSMYTIFIAAFLVLCLIPLVCMAFARSDETIGNEAAVSAPSFTDAENRFNFEILEDTGTWFEHHFAFRPQLITADARIQAGVFQVSNTDTVMTGKDGWLYYSSTLNDFLGREALSERGMWNLAHNLSLLQAYVEGQGARFLFFVPPNKNTLYGEHMPYYAQPVKGAVHNRDSLSSALEAAGVNYLDLFALFEAQDEVLYLKQDSHWNNQGALMVYNQAMDRLGKEHETYADTPVTRAKSHHGDLTAMIYPASSEKEWDYTYEYEQGFAYQVTNQSPSDTVSVEDPHIETTCAGASGSLLMYRDSFGNTLIPFFSECYANAMYSKGVPYNLASDMETYHPDTVVAEKVERNVADFAKDPGIIPAPVRLPDQQTFTKVASGDLVAEPCISNRNYVEFRGTVPEEAVSPEGRLYLGFSDASGTEMVYEAFTVCTGQTDYGFVMYLPLARFGTIESIDIANINVYTN